ncbi:hypothetical protein [Bacteroides stercorirosoris]|uniref:hypothetical protein n=1 Tax=Bacteroides stercorirosoris TaxID=871324 RepID=UPI00216AEE89|nr:hypothetical protein [Bacteroides stercorirosoris]
MMEEKKENDFKMDTEDLRLLNAFGEALGDLPRKKKPARHGMLLPPGKTPKSADASYRCGLPALQLPS